MKQKIIVGEIGVHPSTINRELSRIFTQLGKNADAYLAANALHETHNRHFSKHKIINSTAIMKNQAIKWLSEKKWNPEIISVFGHETGKCPISAEWIC